MSRVGKLPIEYSSKTQVTLEDDLIVVKGPKGELRRKLHPKVRIEVEEGRVLVNVNDPEDRRERAFWGLYRSLVNNMVKGVEEGFQKQVEISGVGYKAIAKGEDTVEVHAGFSHPVECRLPTGVSASVEGNVITVQGIDKELVGKAASEIRNVKKAEPYKGKGLKYVGEEIKRKEGKAGSK